MKHIKLLIIFSYVLILAGCGGGSDGTTTGAAGAAANGTDMAGMVVLQNQILVISDSIGNGTGATSNFPSILEGLTGIPVVNASTSGISAEGGASRTQELISRFSPMYLVLLLGTNNATGAGGGINGAINSLRFAAGVANAAGVVPIIGTLPPIRRSSSENASAFAISGGILGIDNARIARIDTAVTVSEISDGLHPNDSGQNKIASLFASQIF